MFARQRDDRSVVLKIEATPEMIVARLADYSDHATALGEFEYLVDPEAIRGRTSIISTFSGR